MKKNKKIILDEIQNLNGKIDISILSEKCIMSKIPNLDFTIHQYNIYHYKIRPNSSYIDIINYFEYLIENDANYNSDDIIDLIEFIVKYICTLFDYLYFEEQSNPDFITSNLYKRIDTIITYYFNKYYREIIIKIINICSKNDDNLMFYYFYYDLDNNKYKLIPYMYYFITSKYLFNSIKLEQKQHNQYIKHNFVYQYGFNTDFHNKNMQIYEKLLFCDDIRLKEIYLEKMYIFVSTNFAPFIMNDTDNNKKTIQLIIPNQQELYNKIKENFPEFTINDTIDSLL